jgi:hypothetical protein
MKTNTNTMNASKVINIPRGVRVEIRTSISGKNPVYRVTHPATGAMGDDVRLDLAVEQCIAWRDRWQKEQRNERRRLARK